MGLASRCGMFKSRTFTAVLVAATFASPPAFAEDLAPVNCQASPSPLFSSNEVIELTMKGTFPTPVRNHELEIPIVPGTISYKDASGQEKSLVVNFQSRGKSKASLCQFRPVRILWNDDHKKAGSPFENLKGKDMKLATHCTYTSGTIAENPEPNEDIIKEYSVYKLLKALGFETLEVRLAKINYVNEADGSTVEGLGFFLEPNPAFAKRCGLSHTKKESLDQVVKARDPRIDIPFLLARLIVDSSDYFIQDPDGRWHGHNAELFESAEKRARLAIPYDFNDSLLVGAGLGGIGFGAVEVHLKRLRNGAGLKSYETNYLSPEAQPGWTAALLAETKRVLSKWEKAQKTIEELPMSEESKAKFRARLKLLEPSLKAMVEVGAAPIQP